MSKNSECKSSADFSKVTTISPTPTAPNPTLRLHGFPYKPGSIVKINEAGKMVIQGATVFPIKNTNIR